MTHTSPPNGGSGVPVPRPDRRPWRPVVTLVVVVLSGLVAWAAGAVVRSDQAADTAWVWVWSAALTLAGALLATGWALLQNLPSRRGTTAVLLFGALLCYGPAVTLGAGLSWLPAALAVATIAEFVHQLARRDGRPRLVESVSSVVGGLAIVACGALMMPADGAPASVATVCAGVAAAALADPLATRRGGRVGGVLAGILAALAGGLVCAQVGEGSALVGAAVAGVAGLFSLAIRRVHSAAPYLYGRRAQAASAGASILVVGALAEVLRRFAG